MCYLCFILLLLSFSKRDPPPALYVLTSPGRLDETQRRFLEAQTRRVQSSDSGSLNAARANLAALGRGPNPILPVPRPSFSAGSPGYAPCPSAQVLLVRMDRAHAPGGTRRNDGQETGAGGAYGRENSVEQSLAAATVKTRPQ